MFKPYPDLIVFSPEGRLGNRLQTASYALAYAAETHLVVWLLCLEGYEHFFSGSCQNGSCKYPEQHNRVFKRQLFRKSIKYFVWKLMTICERFPWLRELLGLQILTGSKSNPVVFDQLDSTSRITRYRLTIVRGYYIYCDPKILAKQKRAVTDYLKPTGEVWNDCIQRVKDRRQHSDIVVGVHIRHGDYVHYNSGEHFYTFDEYLGLLKTLCQNEPDRSISFIICSDTDLSKVSFDGISWEVGPGDPIGDMYTLAACDYVIGPFSTFNRWSAFYGNAKRLELRRDMNRISLQDFSSVHDLTYVAPGLQE